MHVFSITANPNSGIINLSFFASMVMDDHFERRAVLILKKGVLGYRTLKKEVEGRVSTALQVALEFQKQVENFRS